MVIDKYQFVMMECLGLVIRLLCRLVLINSKSPDNEPLLKYADTWISIQDGMYRRTKG